MKQVLAVSFPIALGWLGIPPLSWALTFTPGLRGEIRFDDNLLRQSERVGEVFSVFTPEMTIRGAGKVRWEMRGRHSIASYYSNRPMTSTLSDHAELQVRYSRSPQDSLSADLRFVKSRDPIQFDERSILIHGDARRSVASARMVRWRGEASVRFRDWAYGDRELFDGRHYDFRVSMFPVRTSNTTGLVAYRWQDLDVSARGLTVDVVTTGVRRTHTPTLQSEVEIGAARIRSQEGSPVQWRPAAAVGLTHERRVGKHRATARVRVADDVTTTAKATVEVGDAADRLSLSWQRLLDVEGGIYQDPTEVRRWTLELSHNMWKTRVLTLGASHDRTQPYQRSGCHTESARAFVLLRVPLREGLTLRTGYDLHHQRGSSSSTAPDVWRNRITMSVTTSL